MATQACPNCQTVHDTSVYVTGQRLLCKCGIRFEVKRNDASVISSKKATDARAQPAPEVEVVRSPAAAAPPGPPAAPSPDDPFAATALHAEGLAEPGGDDGPRPQVPGYEMLGLIGRGGMGEVWRARQVSLQRDVAIKILPARLAKDREFVARFDKEATALAKLSHPNIIQIIDRGIAGEQYFFAMEYVQGRSLRQVISQGRLPPQEALKVVAQICRAIDYAHDQGIVHRDLKPENILIDERGHVKVADFGLAGIKSGSGSGDNLTATAVAMGTLNYMAPEQRRDAKNVDGRADLYSLGVILYELLTGELPLGRFKLPSERDASLDVRLDSIVARSLDTEPDGRYARASIVGAEVEALISSVSSVVVPGAAPAPVPAPRATNVSVVQKGWSAARYGLTVIGALTVAGLLLRGPLDRLFPHRQRPHEATAPATFPANSNRTLRASATASTTPAGQLALSTGFDSPGDGVTQELNANDGDWMISNGTLQAVQAGNVATKTRLRPRAYLSLRYFSTDDFSAEVQMRYHTVDELYRIGQDVQRFSELSLRFSGGVQVSVFAIPDTGVRLLWQFRTPSGDEVAGNSAQDVDSLGEDEVTPPPEGTPFTVRLWLHKTKDGTVAEAFLNGDRVARELLEGMATETGKVALGCRNLRCEFDNLKIVGKAVPRPKKKVVEAAEGTTED